MKAIVCGLMLIGLAALMFQLYRLYGQENALQEQLGALRAKITPVAKENARMRDDIAGLGEKDAVFRELRRAGYAAPGEKVFVIVPKRP